MGKTKSSNNTDDVESLLTLTWLEVQANFDLFTGSKRCS